MTDGQEIPSVVEETNSVLSAQALVCNICGENHETEDCTLLQNAKPMPDTQAVSRARLTLPSSLELRTLADGSTTVVAKVIVESGTLFGPFEAQLSVDMHPGVYFPLKIFGKTACEGYYLDTTDEETCNWMCLVAPATTNKEQNLMCYDMKESIYYSVTRDVLPGEELKVWYALYYGFKLQALPLTDDTSEDGFWDFVQETPVPKSNHSSGGLIFGQELVETLAQHLPAQTLGAKRERDTWKCRLCNVQETNVASYARHLMAHYHRPVSSSDTSSCPVCHTHLFPMKSVVKQNECKCQNRTQQLSEQVVNGSSSITVSNYFKSNEPSTNKSSGDSTHFSEESNTARMSDDQRLSPILEQWKQQQQQQQRQQHQQQRQQRRQKQQRQKRQREQWQRKRSKWQQRLKDRNQEADLTVHQNKLQQAEDTENGAIVSCSNVDGHGGSTGKLMSLASISSLELHNINLGCENATLYDVTDSDSATSLKVLRSKLDPDSQADDDESTDKLVKVKRGESLPGTMDANNITYQEVRGEISTNSMVLSEIMPNVFNDNIVKDYPQEENNSDGNQTQSSEYSVVSRTQLILQTEDGASIPTTFHFDGSQSINVALDNGEPVTFILVNSPNDEQFPVDGDNLHCPDTVGELNIKMNCDESKTVEDLKVLSNNRDGSLPLDGCRSPETNASEGSCVDTASEETQSGFTCDICNKTFDKSAYLYRHLRKHTGEFTCMTCLAVFARKENLMLHSCSRRVMRYPCPSCGKKFSAKKYLQRHLPLHTGQFTCKDCHRSFVSKMSLSLHRCPAGQQEIEGSSSVTCSLCQLMFPDQVKLQAHLKHHSDVSPDGTRGYLTSTMVTRKTKKHHQRFNKHSDVKSGDENTSSTDKDYVCEICGAGFKSASSMKTHSFLHGERRFECEVCNKRFHRKDVLQDHLTVHQTAKLPCLICGKKYKTKKSLDVHIMTHGGTKRFSCEECGKEFFQKGNLLKHQQTHTPSTERTFTCEHCNKTFTSKEYFNVHTLEHTQGKIFSCEKCNKSFVKKHFLESHRQLYHSNRVFLCPFCNSFMRHRHSARRHLEQRHDANRSEWSTKGFIDRMLAHLPDKSLTAPSDGSLTSGHQQQRQQMLFNLRRQHFGDNFVPHTGSTVAEDQSTDYLYTILPNSDTQLTLNQGDQHSASQPVKQLTLLDNFLLGSLSCEVPSACSADLQENEILLTVVGTNACKDQQNASISASVEGNTYVLEEDSGGTEGVLLYVLESADVGDTQDLFWDSGQGEASCAER